MDVTVRFFATYRETVGLRETTVGLPTHATVGDLLSRLLEAHPDLRKHRAEMLLAVNRDFAEPDMELHPGDEVALLPPVSGGGPSFCRIQTEAIVPELVLGLVQDVRAGAVVLFLGTVRADPGVAALDYEAYEEMAVRQMESLRSAAKERFGVTEMAIAHRTGRLPRGETSVAIACSAPHRREAFRAAAWAIEELKKIVPVWKMETK